MIFRQANPWPQSWRVAGASGKPAYGVGPGNSCQIVAEDADIADAANRITSYNVCYTKLLRIGEIDKASFGYFPSYQQLTEKVAKERRKKPMQPQQFHPNQIRR